MSDGSGGTGASTADGADATAVFDLVSDGTRVAILQALVDAQRTDPRDPTLSFSALREAVGLRDSGQFNYHLDKLRGRFVQQTDTGYALTYAGLKIAAAILAGAYEPSDAHEAHEAHDAHDAHEAGTTPGEDGESLEADCPICGQALTGQYHEGVYVIACPNDHGLGNGLPPGAIEDREPRTVAGLLELVSRNELRLASRGTCALCYGPVTWSSELDPPVEVAPLLLATCERCGHVLTTAAGYCVLDHPAVVSFCWAHGVDLREEPYWSLPFAMAGGAVLAEDPLRVRVEVTCEGVEDVLPVVVGPEGTVIEVEAP